MNKQAKLALNIVFTVPVIFLFWMVFVGTFAAHELLIGVLATLITGIGLFIVDVHYPADFSATIGELLSFWRLGWYALSGTAEIVLAAAKDLLGIKRAQSLFRVAEFDAGKANDENDTARRVLAVLYTSATPSSIVLGINSSNQKLLFHQIERSAVPKMTKELGARS